MIKKLIVVGLFCMLSTSIYAQQIAIDFNKNKDNVSPIVREKMDEFQLKIQEVVNEEKLKLDMSIQQVDQDLEANKLSKEEAKERKQQLAESTSETINQRIKSVNFDLDELIKKQVAFTILNGNEEESIVEKLRKKYKATHDLGLYIGYGVLGFSDKNDGDLDNHLSYKNSTELGISYEKQFSARSPWSLKSGLFFSWRTIRLEDNYRFNREAGGTTDIILNDTSLSKSKLRATYLMLPLGVKYSFGEKLTVEDFTYYKPSKFSIGANVYGGVKLSNNNIYKGDGVKSRDKKDYNLNQFVYGAQLTFNYGAWNLYVRKEFSDYFKNNSFDNRKMFQIGVGLGF